MKKPTILHSPNKLHDSHDINSNSSVEHKHFHRVLPGEEHSPEADKSPTRVDDSMGELGLEGVVGGDGVEVEEEVKVEGEDGEGEEEGDGGGVGVCDGGEAVHGAWCMVLREMREVVADIREIMHQNKVLLSEGGASGLEEEDIVQLFLNQEEDDYVYIV